MTKRGSKPLGAEDKQARATLRPGRESKSHSYGVAAPLELRPADDLPYDVSIVWSEYAAAAVANGAQQCDADTFAEWCTMTANLRQSRALAGTEQAGVAPAAYLAQWRLLGEAFGLAGKRSRVGMDPRSPAADNPFQQFRKKRPEQA